MIRQYYYNKQFKKAAIVFANIFAGMQVETGLNACGETEMINVPVRYGSTDRVASHIGSANTQNKLHTIPMMSVYMTGIDLAPERMHGNNHLDRRTMLEQGGVYPDDVKGIYRLMPVPYDLVYELGIYASNTDQAWQILEQVLILFSDYTLQVQFDDAPFNWARQTSVILEGISNEAAYPTGTERQAIIWTLTFRFHTWLSLPMEIRSEIVSKINISFGENPQTIEEIDENGDLIPFEPTFGNIEANVPSSVEPANPGMTTPVHDSGLFNASLEPCHNVQPPSN